MPMKPPLDFFDNFNNNFLKVEQHESSRRTGKAEPTQRKGSA